MGEDSRTSAPTALDTPRGEERRKAADTRREEQQQDGGDERFAVKGEIARGGMGRVLRAHDKQLGRTVAIKEMLESSRTHERRFEREVEITARLQHPSILPLYDSRRWRSGSPYYVMRLVSGRPLSRAIRKCGSLDERLALVPNVLAAADAIAFAHHEGIIHRDIKPSNILVGEHGETVVIDWGIAKILGEHDDPIDDAETSAPPTGDKTMPGAVLGTAGYMPPEQAVGKPVDERADVYALGATLYQLLAGEAPYGGADSSRLVAKQMSAAPPSITKRAPGTPTDLVAIVNKALAANADDRYADAGEFAADLRAFTTGRLVAAHDYSVGQRLRRFARRHRAAVVVALAASLALAAILISSLSRIRTERNQAVAAGAEAERRAQELLIARSGALAPTDPTTAVAQLKRLPLDSKLHAKAREVFREARTRGIARRLPGGGRHFLEWLPGGDTLVAVHGPELWLHDLSRSSARSRLLFEDEDKQFLHAAIVDKGRRVAVVKGANELILHDIATGERQSHQLPGPVTALKAPSDGRFVLWRLEDGRLGRTVISTLEQKIIALGVPTDYLTVSLDGRWIGAGDLRDMAVVFRDEERVAVPQGLSRPTFGNHSQRIAMTSMEETAVFELSYEDGEFRELERWKLDYPVANLIFDGRNHLATQTIAGEVYRLFKSRTFKIDRADGMPQIVASRHGLTVFMHEELHIYETSKRILRLPRAGEGPARAAMSEHFAAVANFAGELFIFDLRAVMPRRHPIGKVQQFDLTSETTGYGLRLGGEIFRIDLETGEQQHLATSLPLGQLSVYEDIDTILVSMIDQFQIVRISDGKVAPKMPFSADVGLATGPGEVMFAKGATIYRYNPFEMPSPEPLWTFEDKIKAFAQTDGEIYAVSVNGLLSRGIGKNAPTTQLDGEITSLPTADKLGVIVAVGNKIYRWRSGEPELLATLPRTPMLAYPEPGGSVLAVAPGAIYTIRDGEVAAAAMPRLSRGPYVTFKGQLAFGLSNNKRVAVTSFQRNHTWLLGGYLLIPRLIAASPTSAVYGVVLQNDELEVYDLRVPRGPAALRLELELATRATVGDDLEALVWPDAR